MHCSRNYGCTRQLCQRRSKPAALSCRVRVVQGFGKEGSTPEIVLVSASPGLGTMPDDNCFFIAQARQQRLLWVMAFQTVFLCNSPGRGTRIKPTFPNASCSKAYRHFNISTAHSPRKHKAGEEKGCRRHNTRDTRLESL